LKGGKRYKIKIDKYFDLGAKQTLEDGILIKIEKNKKITFIEYKLHKEFLINNKNFKKIIMKIMNEIKWKQV
jgi:CRISPR/Cas system CSM-associated protein Csm4 (group 5 of RAMP superfamily)